MSLFIIYIIRWAVVLTLLYSLYGLIMKRETLHSLNRMVLLAVLAASMVLPLVQMETKKTNVIVEGREMLEQQIKELQTSSLPLIGEEEQVDDAMSTTSRPSRGETETGAVVLSAIILIYFIGLIIAWLRYIISLATLIRIIHIGKRIEIDGLPKGIKVLTHPAIKTPCSWMRWVLLNPADKNLITPLSNRRGVGGEALLCHELSHIHYGHSFDMLLCELTCRMLWCLPFAWMLRQDLRDVHEFQADRRVLQNGIDENEYQLLLIRKATTSGLQPVVNALNQSPIKRRFQMMYKKPSRRWVAMKAAYLLPLSALAIVAFARPQTMAAVENNIAKAENKVMKSIRQTFTPKSEPSETVSTKEQTVEEVSKEEEIPSEPTDTKMVLTDLNELSAEVIQPLDSAPSVAHTMDIDTALTHLKAPNIPLSGIVGKWKCTKELISALRTGYDDLKGYCQFNEDGTFKVKLHRPRYTKGKVRKITRRYRNKVVMIKLTGTYSIEGNRISTKVNKKDVSCYIELRGSSSYYINVEFENPYIDEPRHTSPEDKGNMRVQAYREINYDIETSLGATEEELVETKVYRAWKWKNMPLTMRGEAIATDNHIIFVK
jgi:beta-lactamase regulating signal transducer with metallopeptidase domain